MKHAAGRLAIKVERQETAVGIVFGCGEDGHVP